eukprot:TRINITY_DN45988_c0_g1_i1.p1 TRINITY_DN45988_c0_g1~~TRINITY_DN45988_c0_g1_i1.p1  ORF type:complete len:753 (+),score=177.43 TRINITY_DN45988_c0_g1_i1:105-2363(+)
MTDISSSSSSQMWDVFQGAHMEILIFFSAFVFHYVIYGKRKSTSTKQKSVNLKIATDHNDGNTVARSLSSLLNEAPVVETNLKISGSESASQVKDLLQAAGPETQLVVVKAAIAKQRFDVLTRFLALHPASGQGFSQISLLKNLVRKNLLDEALQCIKVVPPSAAAYNAVLEVLVERKDVQKTREIISLAQKVGQLDANGYNALIRVLTSSGQPEQAKKAMSKMATFGLRPNLGAFHALLEFAVKSSPCDEDSMFALVQEIKAIGLSPNNATCAILLKSLQKGSREGSVKRVLQIVDDRLREQPDDTLLGSLCEACNRSGYMHELLPRLKLARKRDGPLKVKCAHTVGSIIRAHASNHDLNGVWRTWREMKENQVQPSRITIGCMVEALASNGEADSALAVINEALADPQSKDLVNAVMYSSVLKTFSQDKQFDRVWSVYQEMLDRNIQFTVTTFNALLDACARSQEIDRAAPLLRAMSDQNITPNIITYGTVIKAYCAANQLDAAFEVFEDMQQTPNMAPDEVVYNTLLDGCARYGRFERGMKVIDTMRAAGIPASNFTLSLVAKLASRSKQPEKAFELVEQLQAEFKVELNMHVFNNLLHAASLTRDLPKAKSTFAQMLSQRVKPDGRTFSLFLRTCISNKAFETALVTLRAAVGLAQDSELWTRNSTDCQLLAALRYLPSRGGAALKRGTHAIPHDVIQDVFQNVSAYAQKSADARLQAEAAALLQDIFQVMPGLQVDIHVQRRLLPGA